MKSTGGGSNKLHHLDNTEEAVSDILNMNRVKKPPGLLFGINNAEFHVEEDLHEEVQSEQENNEPFVSTASASQKRQAKKRRIRINPQKEDKAKKIALLELQTNNFQIFSEYQKERLDLEKKKVELKEEKLRIYKQDILHKQRIREQKLEIEMQILMLQQQHDELHFE